MDWVSWLCFPTHAKVRNQVVGNGFHLTGKYGDAHIDESHYQRGGSVGNTASRQFSMKNKNTKFKVGDKIFKTFSTAIEYARIKGLEVKSI